MPFLLFLMLRLLTRPLVGLRGGASSKDLEILILRHQLRVLGRKTGPPKFTPLDRAVLAAASRSLHRSAWAFETPVRSPRANAYAERWVRTVRANVWTGSSYSDAGTSSWSFGPTSVTATAAVRIGASAWGCRSHPRRNLLR